MVRLALKSDCTGCTACFAACPAECISMALDSEGFAYPVIDQQKCIECGRCESACPAMLDGSLFGANPVIESYAVANRDSSVRAKSTSGGAFGALSRVVVDAGGVVFGARFGDDFTVVHDCAETFSGVNDFFGSKYVQSDLFSGRAFEKVRDYLEEGRQVLFCGCPCQVQGLRSFLGKDYESLVLCDFVCRAVPSPGEWKKYLEYMEEKHHSRVADVVFRNKTYGYHSGTMKVSFENGDTYYGSGRVDPFYRLFFGGYICRPCCHECAFREGRHCSDLTLFDCWSYEANTGKKDDNMGHTSVWVRTPKGADCLRTASEYLELANLNYLASLGSDGSMSMKRSVPNVNRDAFLFASNEYGFEQAISEYLPTRKSDYVLERIKRSLYSLGVLSLLSKAKRARKMRK